ncbi:MAG: TetR/AcrR family transcriptional regulator [Spongiibacteraceae bacterium]
MNSSEKLQPRKLPSQQRAEKRVAEIIAAYRRLLDGDARRITTNSIAQAAGIPVSSLYQYFPNKESIAFAVYRQWAEEALAVLRARKKQAESVESWHEYLLESPTGFFNSTVSARIVHQLGPVMDTSPELKAAQREYLAQMATIVVETLRILGSDWPDKPLANIVTLLIELNTTTFRHIARQSGNAADETFGHWQIVARALLQRCIEKPYLEVSPVDRAEGEQ